jgi:quinol monooxygenase YgiN
MNVTLVEINIKPERVDEFLEVFRANHEGQSRSRETCVLTYCRTRG